MPQQAQTIPGSPSRSTSRVQRRDLVYSSLSQSSQHSISFLLKTMTLNPYPASRPPKNFSHQYAIPNSKSYHPLLSSHSSYFNYISSSSFPLLTSLPFSFVQCFAPHQTPTHEPNYPYQELPASQILIMYLRMHVSPNAIASFQFKNLNNGSGLCFHCTSCCSHFPISQSHPNFRKLNRDPPHFPSNPKNLFRGLCDRYFFTEPLSGEHPQNKAFSS
jgi:hypothetical protein